MLPASIVLVDNGLQLFVFVELVFTTPYTKTFCFFKLAFPDPVDVKLTGNVAKPLTLDNASLLDACSVNELVVTDPTK